MQDSSSFAIKKKKSFSIVDNIVLRDKNLSLASKGLYSILCGYSDDMNLSFRYLQSLSSNGRDSLRSCFDELQKFGYIIRQKLRNHFTGRFYILIEIVDLSALSIPSKSPVTENPSLDKSALTGNPPVDFPPLDCLICQPLLVQKNIQIP